MLLINGEHDLDDFMQVAKELASSLPDVRRVIVPNAGGFPFWEYPAVVNTCVNRFLERQKTI